MHINDFKSWAITQALSSWCTQQSRAKSGDALGENVLTQADAPYVCVSLNMAIYW